MFVTVSSPQFYLAEQSWQQLRDVVWTLAEIANGFTRWTNWFCLGCVLLLAFAGLGTGKCCGCVLLLQFSWSLYSEGELEINPRVEVNLITKVSLISDKRAVYLSAFLLDPNELFFLWTVICFKYSKHLPSMWRDKQELMPACFSYILMG